MTMTMTMMTMTSTAASSVSRATEVGRKRKGFAERKELKKELPGKTYEFIRRRRSEGDRKEMERRWREDGEEMEKRSGDGVLVRWGEEAGPR